MAQQKSHDTSPKSTTDVTPDITPILEQSQQLLEQYLEKMTSYRKIYLQQIPLQSLLLIEPRATKVLKTS